MVIPRNTRFESRLASKEARVVVEVRDTGCGIPDDVAPRIFDPFFTTKSGAGTGLGLAMCHRIVAELGGELDFESAAGVTSFRVKLPPASKPEIVARAVVLGDRRAPAGADAFSSSTTNRRCSTHSSACSTGPTTPSPRREDVRRWRSSAAIAPSTPCSPT